MQNIEITDRGRKHRLAALCQHGLIDQQQERLVDEVIDFLIAQRVIIGHGPEVADGRYR